MEFFLGYFIGLIVGFILGLLGGGGSLMVVAIILVLDIRPINLATAYIGILVGISALFGAIPRIKQKLIDWPTVWALGIPVTLGMLLVRSVLVDLIPDLQVGDTVITKRSLVLLLMATLILLSFATMIGLIGKNLKPRTRLKYDKPIVYYSVLIVTGLLIGILPGFAGAGGGVLIVPMLVIFFGVEMKTVVGTCLAIVTLKSFVGFFAGDLPRLAAKEVNVDYGFLAGFAVVMIVGAMIGTWVSEHVNNEKLKRIFAWFLLGLAIFIICKEVFSLA